MEVRFLNFLKGYVRIRIGGSSYDRFLNLCAYHDITLWELLPQGEAYEAYVLLRDFRKLRMIARKSHASVRITGRFGLPFFIHKYRKRKFYIAGIAAAFLFMFWLSSHIWNITVDGNWSQTDEVIFEYLESAGIRHGMPKSQVDCKELASELRNYFTQFSWVAAELNGTRLQIHVKEGILEEKMSDTGEREASGLAASKAGTVVSVYARSGRSVVQPGDTVEKGQLLVSGILPIYDDSKSLCSVQYVAADADVVLRTQTPYREVLPLTAKQKHYTGRQKTCFRVRIGELPFALSGFPDSYEQYDVLAETVQIQLLENFYLPVYVTNYTVKEYTIEEIIYTKQEAEQILQSNLEYFIQKLQEKGVQIFENDVKIEWNEKSAIASGVLVTGESAVRRVAIDRAEEELLKNDYG